MFRKARICVYFKAWKIQTCLSSEHELLNSCAFTNTVEHDALVMILRWQLGWHRISLSLQARGCVKNEWPTLSGCVFSWWNLSRPVEQHRTRHSCASWKRRNWKELKSSAPARLGLFTRYNSAGALDHDNMLCPRHKNQLLKIKVTFWDQIKGRRRQTTVKSLKRGNETQGWRPGMKRIRSRWHRDPWGCT